MIIQVLGLADETLRLSDSRHSEIITRERNTFTLTEGETEFAVEQLSTASAKPRGGWLLYFIGQILSALVRAVVIRKPIYQRCNPILLSAKLKIKPCRYDFLTLFFAAGGYNEDTHTFCPPRLEGDAELVIEAGKYALDAQNVTRATLEETFSKAGYLFWLIMIPFALFVTAWLWGTRALFAIAIFLMIADTAIIIALGIHSGRVKAALWKKAGDSVHYLNLANG